MEHDRAQRVGRIIAVSTVVGTLALIGGLTLYNVLRGDPERLPSERILSACAAGARPERLAVVDLATTSSKRGPVPHQRLRVIDVATGVVGPVVLDDNDPGVYQWDAGRLECVAGLEDGRLLFRDKARGYHVREDLDLDVVLDRAGLERAIGAGPLRLIGPRFDFSAGRPRLAAANVDGDVYDLDLGTLAGRVVPGINASALFQSSVSTRLLRAWPRPGSPQLTCQGSRCALGGAPLLEGAESTRPLFTAGAVVGGLGADLLVSHLERPDGPRRLSRVRPSGAVVWTRPEVDAASAEAYLVDAGVLVIGAGGAWMLDAASGALRWSLVLPGGGGHYRTAIPSGERLIVVSGTTLVAVDAASGAEAWRVRL